MAKSTAKKAASKKAVSKKSAAKKAAPKKATAKKKAPAKKAPAKKAPAKKATSTASAAKKTTAQKPTSARSSAKKAPSKKTTSKTSAAKKSAAKNTAPSPQKKSTPAKKMPVKSTFDKKFLNEMRASLLEERSRYIQSAETLKAEADALVEGREPGDVQFDEESGEGDTLAVERERDLALSAHARAAVEEIDAALGRLDDGTYGICVVSGKPIPKERLRAIPWAAERVEYKAGGFGLR